MTTVNWQHLIDNVVEIKLKGHDISSRDQDAFVSFFDLMAQKDDFSKELIFLFDMVKAYLLEVKPKSKSVYFSKAYSNKPQHYYEFSRCLLLGMKMPNGYQQSQTIDSICLALANTDFHRAINGLLIVHEAILLGEKLDNIERRFIFQAETFLKEIFQVSNDSVGMRAISWIHSQKKQITV